MENKAKSYLCMVVPFSVQILAFYRHNSHEEDPGEIGGANAPPNSPTKPRKRGFGRVSAATWPHPGRENAAKAAFPRLGWGVRGSVCSPDLPGILNVGFLPIKRQYLR